VESRQFIFTRWAVRLVFVRLRVAPSRGQPATDTAYANAREHHGIRKALHERAGNGHRESACKSPRRGKTPTPPAAIGYSEEGNASWYGAPFHGRRSSNGEVYDMNKMTAAHRTLPFDTIVRVTNTNNGKTAVVRITDRGPFVENRILDLSYAAARRKLRPSARE